MQRNTAEPMRDGTKLLVRVLQDLTRKCAYETYADLRDDLKAECAKLRISYDGELVNAAIDRLERGGQDRIVRENRSGTHEPEPFNAPVTWEQAARILAEVRKCVGGQGPKPMPAAKPQSVHETDCRRAMDMVSQEILESVARCEALEAEVGMKSLKSLSGASR